MDTSEPKKHTDFYDESESEVVFTDETMNSLVELGKIVDKVRKRLVATGDYVVEDGKIKKLPTIKF